MDFKDLCFTVAALAAAASLLTHLLLSNVTVLRVLLLSLYLLLRTPESFRSCHSGLNRKRKKKKLLPVKGFYSAPEEWFKSECSVSAYSFHKMRKTSY